MFVPILTLLLECLQIKVSLTRVDVLIVTRLCTSYSSTFVEIEMTPFFGDRSPLPSVSIQTHVFFVLLSRFLHQFLSDFDFLPSTFFPRHCPVDFWNKIGRFIFEILGFLVCFTVSMWLMWYILEKTSMFFCVYFLLSPWLARSTLDFLL